MKFKCILLFIFLTFPIAFAQTDSSGSSESGGSQGVSSLGLIITPANGSIFISPNVDILVSASSNTGISCKFTGSIYNELNEYKNVKYRSCTFCNLKDAYFTLANAYFDAVPGWNYKIDSACNDNSGNSEIKTVYFSVQGNRIEDKTSPEINIKSPFSNVKNIPNANLDFEVNELSHCEYTLASLDSSSGGAGHVSIDGYINNYKSSLSLTEGKDYTLTLKCKDLNDNSVSKEIKFYVSSGATSSGGSGGSSTGGSCQKYYTCPDGSKIEYCKTVTKEIPITCVPSDIPGVGPICSPGSVSVRCECIENPESLCPEVSTTSTTIITETSTTTLPKNEELVKEEENDKLECNNGCILNNKCVPIGYRVDKKYCNLDNKFIEQKSEDLICENNFECSSNLCVDNKCVSSGLWQKILRFFTGLFRV